MKFAQEKVDDVWDEALPLLELHQAEAGIAGEKFSADRETYKKSEQLGLSSLFTARSDEGKLLGYAVFVVTPHQQYKNRLMAFQDAIFVLPEHRGYSAVRFIDWVDTTFRNRGVNYITRHVRIGVNPTIDYRRTLERMGYQEHSIQYVKEL